MATPARSVAWEATAHSHVEKSSDWFWALGILAVSAGAASLFFGNFLLTILILLAASIVAIVAKKEPPITEFAVTVRGLRVGDNLYPYSTLEAYYIDEDDPNGPQLLARSNKLFMHLIVMPLPVEHIEDIEDILETRLPEEFMEEPLGTKILEIFGF